jgi:hypothetical protein
MIEQSLCCWFDHLSGRIPKVEPTKSISTGKVQLLRLRKGLERAKTVTNEDFMPTSRTGDNGPSQQDMNVLLSMKQSINDVKESMLHRGSQMPQALAHLVAELDPIEQRLDGLISGSISWSLDRFLKAQGDCLHQFDLIMKEQQKEIDK